mgnify:FL=1
MADTQKPSKHGFFTSNNGKTHIGKKWSNFTDPTDGMANRYGLYVDIHRRQVGLNVRFKAFLTNFTDTFDMLAQERGYIGEPDVLLKMQGMKRSFELAFDIPAANVFQAKLNLRNVSLLTKACYPMGKMAKLHGGGQRWKPITGGDPQFKIKFLNLITDGSEESGELASSGPSQISGLRGWIDDLTYDFKLDSDGAGFLFHPDEYGFAYPKVISLSFRFVPYFENTRSTQ